MVSSALLEESRGDQSLRIDAPQAPKPVPRVIDVDKNAAYPKASADLKAMGVLSESVELRQIKYLNNIVEQDHRFIKRLVKPGLAFFSFEGAWRTLQGDESMNMIRKGQIHGVVKGDITGQVTPMAFLGNFLQHNRGNCVCYPFVSSLPVHQE